jgi:DNA-binding IclR family transcriptional regulator
MTARRWCELEPDLPYRPDAAIAAALGYATSHDEVITGVSSVAVPLRFPHEPVAALAVVYIRSDRDPAGIAAVLAAAARRIEQSGT